SVKGFVVPPSGGPSGKDRPEPRTGRLKAGLRTERKIDVSDSAGKKQMRFRRILLKLSGEALMGEVAYGIDPKVVLRITQEVKEVHDLGVEVALVVGGGNIFRGLQASATGMDRASADYMGMLATVMNAIALQDALEKLDVFTRVVSAIEMREIAEPFIRRRAIRHLEKGRVVIF